MWPIVLVSCYYRLADHDPSYRHYRTEHSKIYRAHEEYLHHGRMFFCLRVPKILFVDPERIPEMNELLFDCASVEGDRSILSLCKIVPWSFRDLPLYTRMREWSAFFTTPDKYGAGYHILVLSKTWFVEKAMSMRVWESRSIGFLDFGIAYLRPLPDTLETDLYMRTASENAAAFHVMLLEYHPVHITCPFEEIAPVILRNHTGHHFVSAGLWFGPPQIIQDFIRRVDAVMEWILSHDDPSRVCLEEYVYYLALFYDGHLRRCDLPLDPWLGTYTHLLANVGHARQSLHQVCHHLHDTLRLKDTARARPLLPYLLRSLESSPDTFWRSGLFGRALHLLIWGFYYQPDDQAVHIFRVMSLLCRDHQRLRKHDETQWDDLCANFVFYWSRFRDALPFPKNDAPPPTTPP